MTLTPLHPDERRLDEGLGDPRELRAAFSSFPSGVAALCAEVDGTSVGLVATSFSVGVSYDPPLVLFSVQKSSTTWPVLRRADRIGISILGAGQSEACLQLSSRSRDRFAGLDGTRTERGALLLDGAALWLDCAILSETPTGDHAIVVLEVHGLRTHAGVEPLVYHGSAFRSLADAS